MNHDGRKDQSWSSRAGGHAGATTPLPMAPEAPPATSTSLQELLAHPCRSSQLGLLRLCWDELQAPALHQHLAPARAHQHMGTVRVQHSQEVNTHCVGCGGPAHLQPLSVLESQLPWIPSALEPLLWISSAAEPRCHRAPVLWSPSADSCLETQQGVDSLGFACP